MSNPILWCHFQNQAIKLPFHISVHFEEVFISIGFLFIELVQVSQTAHTVLVVLATDSSIDFSAPDVYTIFFVFYALYKLRHSY